MITHPPDGPAAGIRCGQCGADEPLDEHSPEPRCADVTACLDRQRAAQRRQLAGLSDDELLGELKNTIGTDPRLALLPPAEQRAARIRDLSGLQCKAVVYLIGAEHPGLADDAMDRVTARLSRGEVITGRSDLGPVRHPATGSHDVRVRRSGTGLTVYCDPCEWKVHVESGHAPAELAELEAQHAGGAR